MLALANQKIGHEARDYFRSRTGVDFYFGSITRAVGPVALAGGPARACTGTCNRKVPDAAGRHFGCDAELLSGLMCVAGEAIGGRREDRGIERLGRRGGIGLARRAV